jgi:hypothetical protein
VVGHVLVVDGDQTIQERLGGRAGEKFKHEKEYGMTACQLSPETRAGAFDTVPKADQAVRRLLAAGFTQDQLTVVCPAEFKDQCLCAPGAEPPRVSGGEAMAKGAVAGVALGGLALGAAVLTGGLSVPAAALLIGGSAFAGGFSNLIVNKGYEVEAHPYCQQAIQAGRIVVGVDVRGDDSADRLAQAQHILTEAGAA